jgi:hypothetical protein
MAIAGFFVPVLLGIEDGRSPEPLTDEIIETAEPLTI